MRQYLTFLCSANKSLRIKDTVMYNKRKKQRLCFCREQGAGADRCEKIQEGIL
ncbi:hypothetical protein BRYFOR_05764 [Marvinbryantia formatexigens DSM 14469]|uniref:Uncharacterized protein n=1 Tax=Marvinbryantia formatexigens DSM 14469 TaxID=478749 RepID=C6LAX0_9FIRM|nr:hypothetical protein BRYFOR_05764 [Marvinbryantia formatexigens DSM 14469]